MTIEEIYLKNKKNLSFSDSSQVSILRNSILNKLKNEYTDFKNNESIKNIDLNIFNNLNYHYKINKTLSNISNHDKRIYNLNVYDGFIDSFKDDNIQINKNKFQNIYDDIVPKDDFVFDMNSLFNNCGYDLTIKKNKKINININNHVSEKEFTIFQKLFIKCEEGAEVTIIDNYESLVSNMHNLVIFIDLHSKSKLKHIITEKGKSKSNLFISTFTNIHKNAEYNQTNFNFSDGFVRNHHYADLIGQDSVANYNGVFFLKNLNSSENKTYVRHKSPNCRSDQNYKGILNDFSKGTYNSYTIVEEDAQKTEGYQLSKGILLSNNSIFFSKPELRIFADDVKCSHGSTIGPIDDQIVYYIRSRGINKKEAINMLIRSFVEENIDKLNNLIVQKKIENHINQYLLSIN